MLVQIIIVSYGTPLILAFNFDFLSPVEPVKIIPRISLRKKISLSNLENGPKTKHHRKDLKTKSCKTFVLNHPKVPLHNLFRKKNERKRLFSPGIFPPPFFWVALPSDLQLHQLAKSTCYRIGASEKKKKKKWKNRGTFFAERYT